MSQGTAMEQMETEQPENATLRTPIPGNFSAKFKATLKLARTIARSEHHMQILNEYVKKNNPPLGLIPDTTSTEHRTHQ